MSAMELFDSFYLLTFDEVVTRDAIRRQFCNRITSFHSTSKFVQYFESYVCGMPIKKSDILRTTFHQLPAFSSYVFVCSLKCLDEDAIFITAIIQKHSSRPYTTLTSSRFPRVLCPIILNPRPKLIDYSIDKTQDGGERYMCSLTSSNIPRLYFLYILLQQRPDLSPSFWNQKLQERTMKS